MFFVPNCCPDFHAGQFRILRSTYAITNLKVILLSKDSGLSVFLKRYFEKAMSLLPRELVGSYIMNEGMVDLRE